MTLATIETARHSTTLITPRTQSVAEKISQHDMTQVRERILKDGVIPESLVDEAIEEYRKWLYIAAASVGGHAMFSKYVDEVWHTHILFTSDYMALTTDICGQYLHHNPFTDSNRPNKDTIRQARRRFVHTYNSLFGERPGAIWTLKSSECNGECGYCDHGSPTRATESHCTSDPGCSSTPCDSPNQH